MAGTVTPQPTSEDLNAVDALLRNNPRYRNVMRWIVNRCKDGAVDLSQLEAQIQQHPSFSDHGVAPYFLVAWLEEAGGLVRLEMTADGKPIDRTELANLSEDDIDDLIASYSFEATEAGMKACVRFEPKRKLAELLKEQPDRRDLYLGLLSLLTTPHGVADVFSYVQANSHLTLGAPEDAPKPTTYLDKLAETGAVTFDGKWVTTPEGKEALAALAI